MPNADRTRVIVESVVDRAIRDIRRDSRRSVRKLVDLGLCFVQGSFQRHFLGMCQRLLRSNASAYYTAAQNAAANVDEETLKRFSMNVGYESCTLGARRIREVERTRGFNVPWVLCMELGREGLSRLEAQRLVMEGMELGIFSYILTDAGMDEDTLLRLSECNPRCAFALLAEPEKLLSWDVRALTQCKNVHFSFHADSEKAEEAAAVLRQARLLYGVFRYTAPESAEERLRADSLEALCRLQPLSVALLPQGGLCQPASPALERQVTALRAAQQYPYFLLVLPGDLLESDRVISDEPCSVCLDRQGRAWSACRDCPTELSVRTAPLAAVLAQAVPRDAADASAYPAGIWKHPQAEREDVPEAE